MRTPQYFKELLLGSNAIMLTNKVSPSREGQVLEPGWPVSHFCLSCSGIRSK